MKAARNATLRPSRRATLNTAAVALSALLAALWPRPASA